MTSDVYELTISAPGRNALSSVLMERLIAELRAAAGRPLLLIGADGAFSAGLNLKEVATLDLAGMTRFLGLLDDLIDALYCYPGPTVACVNGHATAGGCMLVLCCDLRVVADDPALRIGLNEVPLGLEFPPSILEIVATVLGDRTYAVLTEAKLHDPEEAFNLRMVDRIVAPEELETKAIAEAARLASIPAPVFAAIKNKLRPSLKNSPSDAKVASDMAKQWLIPENVERIKSIINR